jgi:formylmethanofuran dehydrogenase subunit A
VAIRLTGGRIYDPLNGIDGEIGDLWIEGGRIVPPPPPGTPAEVHDVSGCVVMPGGIDMHSHIGGGKVAIARLLMAEEHRNHREAGGRGLRAGSGEATPSSFATGYRYARLGYTAAFEPAMLPANARAAHHEMADIPLLDKGAYVLLGNDDLFLRLLAEGAGERAIADYVGWTLRATGALAVKIVNPGGIAAFKYGQRRLDLDERAAPYGITPREILVALAEALDRLAVPHPIHVHGCNLGVPGNMESTLATIRAMEGRRIHLTHLQFHSYGTEGPRRFSSGAPSIAELVNASPNVSLDVGQVMFGHTVTASADTMAQFRNAAHAHPRRWVGMDIECEAGCGVVPFRYKDESFVNALQWAIGLELFLLVDDPWRLALTTDHPNGGAFTRYPELIRLLMDKDFRDAAFARLPQAARELSILPSIRREYSLFEIAILTRAGPARLLGLEREIGHLGPGARADIAVYRDDPDRERMFECVHLLFKNGRLVVRDGAISEPTVEGAIHLVRPAFDTAIEARIRSFFETYRDQRLSSFVLSGDELAEAGEVVEHACRGAPSPPPLRPRSGAARP